MLPGCPLLEVQADVPEVCLTYPNIHVPAAPGLTSLDRSFVFDDLSAVQDLADLEADLQFVRAEVRATSGIDGFGFVEAAHIVISSGDPASTLPALTMYDCDGDCAPDGNRLELPAGLANNAIDYLRTNSIVIDVDFQGQVPTVPWTMDVDVCMKAKAGYTISP
ncbi:MAG TPA: hypothetical protein VFK02_21060 [Kofleriaceae bacterium]|nr:hypothetical protein [Kofleriaceae bacterium]